jgi:hypothetical protein
MGRYNRSGVVVVFVVEDSSLPFDEAMDTFRGQGWGILLTDAMISTVGKYV